MDCSESRRFVKLFAWRRPVEDHERQDHEDELPDFLVTGLQEDFGSHYGLDPEDGIFPAIETDPNLLLCA